MEDNFIKELPLDNELNKMDSEQLTGLSAALTNIKDMFLTEYKLKQERINLFIARKQKEEADARKASDPDYHKKAQGVKI